MSSMRLRVRAITYSFGGASSSLERHYRELHEELLRQGRHYGMLQPSAPWRPPVDIHETHDALLVKLELAGVEENQLEIALYENALVVTGTREDDADHDEAILYHEAQVRYGPFRVEVPLLAPVEADAVEASYQSGFLRVKLPRAVQHAGRPATPGAETPDTPDGSHEPSEPPRRGPQTNRKLNAAPMTVSPLSLALRATEARCAATLKEAPNV